MVRSIGYFAIEIDVAWLKASAKSCHEALDRPFPHACLPSAHSLFVLWKLTTGYMRSRYASLSDST